MNVEELDTLAQSETSAQEKAGDSANAGVLRTLADLLEAGYGRPHVEPAAGAILDAHISGIRCILIADETAADRPLLSPREDEIARLVARGLTNRAIASTLDISLWTVSTHMRRIFAKLDVSSRAEMTAQVCGSPTSPSRR